MQPLDYDAASQTFHLHEQSDTLALILDYDKLTTIDTIVLRTAFAELEISGNERTSQLKLLSVYKYVPLYKDLDYKKKAIRQFEKQFVKKLRKKK